MTMAEGSELTCLDYSFYNLTEVADLEAEEPRQEGKKQTIKRTDDGKFHCRNLKLNNNAITELGTLKPTIELLLVDPYLLTWLDLSFNLLTKIDAVICDLRELKILYLHGNNITQINEVDKLAGLENLQKLSLHGNPVEKVKNYKCYVLCLIQTLKNFDMSSITKNDRKNMNIMSNLQCVTRGMKKKRGAED